VLADQKAPREERVEALKFLVHFIGDLHQPLHRIARDREGIDSKLRAVRALRTLRRCNDPASITVRIISVRPRQMGHGGVDHAKSCTLRGAER